METNDINATVNTPTDVAPDANAASEPETPSSPTVEELMAKIAESEAARAKAEAERDAANRAKDKATKEAAERKREAFANMTEEQKAKEAAEEERKRMAEELEETKKQLNHINAVAAYKIHIADDKTVEQLIDAVSNSDHATIAAIMAAEKQSAVKAAQAEWIKSRPPVNAGGEYASMTLEQIRAISDPDEQLKAMKEHPELFRKD